jgi:thiol:disulfide interchange protein
VSATRSPAGAPSPAFSVFLIQLGLAFIGGLILNIMPCVLPVIALKVLGVVGQNRSDPGRVRKHGFAYGGGVVLSFLLMAGAVVGFRSVGVRLLWGSQFGSPVFLIVLTSLMVLVALSLFGVFEITLSGRVMDAATRASSAATEFFSKVAGGWGAAKTDRTAADGGLADSFFNGVFATIMGVSCTAPVLSAAVGFALTQQAIIVFLMFTSVGLGMATPYVLLCLQPAWLKILPKPGMWMEKFKVAMGFPMLATGVWLFTVAAGIFPGRGLWLGLFLVVLAAAAWVYGEFIQRSLSRRGLAWTALIVLLGIGYGYVLEKELDWRHPPEMAGAIRKDPDGIDWQPWNLDALAKAQARGQMVLVDFTADWCINCQVNKRNAIEVPEVQARLKKLDALGLLADYTRTPEEMSREILSHGRAGVPLVLVYPGKSGAKPEIMPELFTKGMLLEALDRAKDASTR